MSSMSFLSQVIDRFRDGRFSLATLAGGASILCFYRLARGGLLRSNLPRILDAPEKTSDSPYPADIFPNGRDLETPYGRIRYYEFGPENGKKLMCVHGISTPAPVWGLVAPNLIKAGYRLLVFDLYGRGYSDTPLVKHDMALFISQMTLLLAHLPHWDKFDLCGMSLGGGIVSYFAHYFPERVDRLLLLCPAGGTPLSDLKISLKLIRSTLFPTWLLSRILPLVPLLPTPQKGSLGWWQAKNHKGYNYSFSSSLQDGPLFGASEVQRSVISSFGPRVRAIWGDKDDVVPMNTSKYFGSLDVSVIPDGGHFVILTHTEQVLQHMLDFLGTHS